MIYTSSELAALFVALSKKELLVCIAVALVVRAGTFLAIDVSSDVKAIAKGHLHLLVVEPAVLNLLCCTTGEGGGPDVVCAIGKNRALLIANTFELLLVIIAGIAVVEVRFWRNCAGTGN